MPIGAIGNALGRGVTNLARGVARSSQQWPQMGMQQRRLDQQQDQFKRTEGRLDRAQEIAWANMMIARNETLMDMVDKTVAAGDEEGTAMLLSQVIQNNHAIGAVSLTPTDEQLTENVANNIIPGIAPLPTLDGIAGGEPIPDSATPLALAANLIAGERRSDHDELTIGKGMKAMMELAQRGGPTLALNAYSKSMGNALTPELRKEARGIFEAYAALTKENRFGLLSEAWNKTYDRAINKGVLSRELWDTYMIEVNRYGGLSEGILTQEDLEKQFAALRARDVVIDFSEVQARHLAQSGVIKKLAGDALAQMTDTELTDMLGGLEGVKSAIANKYPHVWETLSSEDKQETMDFIRKSTKLRKLINTLASGTDFMTRMMTGAALTEAEQIFYNSLIGTIRDKPHLLRENLKTLIKSLTFYEEEIWKVGYGEKIGRPGLFNEMMDAAGRGALPLMSVPPGTTAPATRGDFEESYGPE